MDRDNRANVLTVLGFAMGVVLFAVLIVVMLAGSA